MLGTKFNKPLETLEQLDLYSQAAAWCNANNAAIEDKGGYYEVVKVAPPTRKELNAAEVERLKAELAATDYKALKYIDGVLTEAEYAEVKAYRQTLRDRINALEK